MTNPLVSVITTVYNCESFIEESLRSIFNQKFKDFELIVYNDSSTDRTLDVIERVLGDFDGKYVFINGVGKNIGCAMGRAKAIERAEGKYLAIHDGDDICVPDRLFEGVEFIESHPDIFCVGSYGYKINSSGKSIDVLDYPKVDHNDFVCDIFNGTNTILDPSTLFRKDVFDRLGGYDASWYLIPDLNLWTRAMIDGCYFSNIPKFFMSYRSHSGSVMFNNLRQTVMQHRMMNKILLKGLKKEDFFRN